MGEYKSEIKVKPSDPEVEAIQNEIEHIYKVYAEGSFKQGFAFYGVVTSYLELNAKLKEIAAIVGPGVVPFYEESCVSDLFKESYLILSYKFDVEDDKPVRHVVTLATKI
jgi:hypothetical protein